MFDSVNFLIWESIKYLFCEFGCPSVGNSRNGIRFVDVYFFSQTPCCQANRQRSITSFGKYDIDFLSPKYPKRNKKSTHIFPRFNKISPIKISTPFPGRYIKKRNMVFFGRHIFESIFVSEPYTRIFSVF